MGKNKLFTLVFSIGLIFLLAVTSLLVACAGPTTPATTQPAQPATPKTLSIGVLAALTGFYTPLDIPDSKDCEIMAKILNEKGGLTIKGQKYNIEIIVEDCKSSLEGTAAAANRLIFDKQVKYILGPGAFFNPAASSVTEPNKVIRLPSYMTKQPGELDASTPYSFSSNPQCMGYLLTGITAMKKEYPNIKIVGYITPDDGSIPTLLPVVKGLLAYNGITIAGDVVGYNPNSQDFSPIGAKLNANKEAEAYVHLQGISPEVAGVVKALRETGNTKPYISCTGAAGNDIVAIAGKDAATNIICDQITPHGPGNPPLVDEMYDRRTGPATPLFAFNPNSLYALISVMKAADSIDPEDVKAKWESSDKIETLFGPAVVCGEKTYGIKNHALAVPLSYQTVVNGEVKSGGWVDIGIIP